MTRFGTSGYGSGKDSPSMPSPVPPLATPSALAPEVGSSPDSSTDPRANFRTKTAGTRLTPAEIEEVERAAKRAGKTLGEWLREVALRAARPTPDVSEIVLQELAAHRYMLLNLFHARARAEQQGLPLLPDAVLQVRDAADARKREAAKKMLGEFLTGEASTGAGKGAER